MIMIIPSTRCMSNASILLLLLLLATVFVFEHNVAVVDASNLIRRPNFKNQMIHAIADVTCNEESIFIRHRRRRRRRLENNEIKNNEIENNEIENNEIENEIETNESANAGGLMWRNNPSSASASAASAASASSGGTDTQKQIAVSITTNTSKEGTAQIYIDLTSNSFEGFETTGCHDYSITGWMNVCDDTLNDIEELNGVFFIKPVHPASTSASAAGGAGGAGASAGASAGGGDGGGDGDRFTGSGSVKSQAITALQITKLLEHYPQLTGEGLKIGIISDSFNEPCELNPVEITEADDIETGNLPSEQDGNRVIVLNDNAEYGVGQCSTDEGRAMAQLIYDLIPGAQMYFYTGFLWGNFAAAIEALVDAGCHAIVDDIFYYEEPIYQLGITARAAEAAVSEGVQYFAASGNFFDQSYETEYKGIPCPTEPKWLSYYKSCLDFGGGNNKQFLDIVETRGSAVGNITLFWDQPWASVSGQPGSNSDFDIYIFEAGTARLVSSSLSDNLNGDSYEELALDYGGKYELVICYYDSVNDADPDGTMIKWISYGPVFNSINPGSLGQPTLSGHLNAPGVAAVAAAASTQIIGRIVGQPRNSLGGIPRLFDLNGTRYSEPIYTPQPRFTGPDGVYNTFLGFSFFSEPPLFFGTSAAAPSVAAVGIMLLQAYTLLKEGQLLDVTQRGRVVRRELKQAKGSKKNKTKNTKKKNTKSPAIDYSLPENIIKIIEETSTGMYDGEYNYLTGNGFVNAFAAIERLIELMDGPSGATNNDEEHCPTGNFLFPIESFYDQPFDPDPTPPITSAGPSSSPSRSAGPSSSPSGSPSCDEL